MNENVWIFIHFYFNLNAMLQEMSLSTKKFGLDNIFEPALKRVGTYVLGMYVLRE